MRELRGCGFLQFPSPRWGEGFCSGIVKGPAEDLAGAAEVLFSAGGAPAASTGETLKTIAEALTNTGMGGESGNRIAKMILEGGNETSGGPVKIVWPVDDPVITSKFGPRPQPVPGASKFHGGLDFRAPLGEQIMSTQNGKVFDIKSNSRSGNHMFIRNDDGSMSSYSHTSPSVSLTVGGRVRAGQVIGTSDNSGNTTGPHLHYVYRQGTPSDPATPARSPVDPLLHQFTGMSYRLAE